MKLSQMLAMLEAAKEIAKKNADNDDPEIKFYCGEFEAYMDLRVNDLVGDLSRHCIMPYQETPNIQPGTFFLPVLLDEKLNDIG